MTLVAVIEFFKLYILPNGNFAVLLLIIVLLAVLGRITKRDLEELQAEELSKPQTPGRSATEKSEIITQLSRSDIEKLNELIQRSDQLQLAIFLASHQCSVRELGSLLHALHDNMTLFLDYLGSNYLQKQASDDVLASEEFHALSTDEQQSIRSFEQKEILFIDKEFIRRFGNLLFMENFIMYEHLCHSDPAIFRIPKGNNLRHMFDTFVKTGLAVQAQSIPAADRLSVLNLTELQSLAEDLEMDQVFENVQEAISALNEHPFTPIRLSDKYSAEDLFLLLQEDWDNQAIEQEWKAYNALAKILLLAGARKTAVEETSHHEPVAAG